MKKTIFVEILYIHTYSRIFLALLGYAFSISLKLNYFKGDGISGGLTVVFLTNTKEEESAPDPIQVGG